MYSYAAHVEPRDRWAIIAYIRALQLSQNATLNDVPAEEQCDCGRWPNELERGTSPPARSPARTGSCRGWEWRALSLVGAGLTPDQFYQSYLVAYLYWLGITLGCIGLVMLHHLVGGMWGFVIRRLLEAGATTVGLMVLLFLPIVLGRRHLYPWRGPTRWRKPRLFSKDT